MINTWDQLKFWDSGEWQAAEEKLYDLESKGLTYCPGRGNLFAALDLTPFESCKVCIMGQDPYPDASLATGVAFSIPKAEKKFPPTLVNIFTEYCEDLHYPFPGDGDLSPWGQQGILLWNVVPTCQRGKPGSHRSWTEWTYLTKEIVECLSSRGIVFILLGGLSKDYLKFINAEANIILSYSHPSPLALRNIRTKRSFKGSRIFSTTNDYLCKLKKEPIDWKLD